MSSFERSVHAATNSRLQVLRNVRGLLQSLLLLTASHILVFGTVELCPGQELPNPIATQLEENAKSMNQLEVQYQVTRQTSFDMDEILRLIKRSKDFFHPDSYRLVFQHGKWLDYYDIWLTNDKGEVYQNQNLTTYDGSCVYSSSLSKTRPVVRIYDTQYLEQRRPLRSIFGYNYFLYDVGFSVSEESVAQWLPLESTILGLLRSGARLIQAEGDSKASSGNFELSLATDDVIHRYTLDLAKHCAVRVHEERNNEGELNYRTENSQFIRLPGTELWLPKLCRMACYTWQTIPGKRFSTPIVLESVVVSKYSNEPVRPSEFVIEWKKPGTLVGDSRAIGAEQQENGVVDYRVPANLDYLDDVVAAASRGDKFEIPMDTSPSRWWLLALNGVVIAVLLLLYVLRRKTGWLSK